MSLSEGFITRAPAIVFPEGRLTLQYAAFNECGWNAYLFSAKAKVAYVY